MVGWEVEINCTVPLQALGKGATGVASTQKQASLLFTNKAKRNASLPNPPALFASLTALPFVDSVALGSCCLPSDFPNFTHKTLARVGTRGWGLGVGN